MSQLTTTTTVIVAAAIAVAALILLPLVLLTTTTMTTTVPAVAAAQIISSPIKSSLPNSEGVVGPRVLQIYKTINMLQVCPTITEIKLKTIP